MLNIKDRYDSLADVTVRDLRPNLNDLACALISDDVRSMGERPDLSVDQIASLN